MATATGIRRSTPPNIPPYRMPLIDTDGKPMRDAKGKPMFEQFYWNEGPEYEHQEYPKWKYHADGREVLVETEAEESELGAEWVNKPFVFKRPGTTHPTTAATQAGQTGGMTISPAEYQEFLQFQAFKAGSRVVAPVPAPAAPAVPNGDGALAKQAEQKGAKVDKRSSIDQLQSALTEAGGR